MTRLARGAVRHLVRPIGSVRRVWRASMVGRFKGVEDKQKKQSHTQHIPPHCKTSLNSSTYRHVDFRIGTTNSPERPSTVQNVEPELPIETVQPEVQDGSQQALSPEEEEIFRSRLLKIWEGMMTFEKTAEWKDIILRFPTNKWLSRITEHIPVDVKSMLVSPHSPTPAQIKSLPCPDTIDGGVFAWCTESNREQDSTEKKVHVYIGSASKCYGGLNFRKKHMLSRLTTPHDEALKLKIKNFDLNSEGEFKRLFTVPFEDGYDGDVMDVRALVLLTRMVLMIWLGAVDERLKPVIKDLVPWGFENIEYLGLAKDNPLTTGINQSGRIKKKNASRAE